MKKLKFNSRLNLNKSTIANLNNVNGGVGKGTATEPTCGTCYQTCQPTCYQTCQPTCNTCYYTCLCPATSQTAPPDACAC